ncbi:lipI, partial [Symbiodinium microadriaticum]
LPKTSSLAGYRTAWTLFDGFTVKFGGDASRLVVMGDSAGGNLAAVASLELSELLCMAIPIYPVIQFGLLSESKVRNADAPILKALSMDWYNIRYFRQRTDFLHPWANPLARPQEQLTRAPYTHVITAEFDVLIEEGIDYMQALKSAGVRVTHKNYANTVHGFFGNQLLTHGQTAMDDVCDILNKELMMC